MRLIFLFSFFIAIVNSQPVIKDMTVGEWQRVDTSRSKNHTVVQQKEILHLKADHTFVWRFIIDLEKGEHFIKGLQVEASGIWKRYLTTLVLVIQQQKLPFAKEVSNTINPSSLQALAHTYQAPFLGSHIHINTITFLNKQKLTILNEQNRKTQYIKTINISQTNGKPKKAVNLQ